MKKKVKVRDVKGLMKSKKIIHPNSRKAKQISRAAHRVDKIDKKKINQVKGMSQLATKLVWFQQNLEEGKSAYTYGEVLDLILNYIHRNDLDIEHSEELRKSGSSSNIKSEILHEMKQSEIDQYYSGFKAPDLTRTKIVKALKNWEGDLNLISNIELKTFVCNTPSTATSHATTGADKSESMNL